ncbi:hypothetical protein OIU79_016888 [Salix purpurea]|uniref:Uncharacterized protein n=1 Tax=Salix purpurea TaxID=77065 RepID=A0A9Q0PFT5_SALPP|nr:hypothetical protein OIU79_016888 [Salix purpurea]
MLFLIAGIKAWDPVSLACLCFDRYHTWRFEDCVDWRHRLQLHLNDITVLFLRIYSSKISLSFCEEHRSVGHFLRQNEHPLTKFLTMENSEVLCRNRFGNAKTNGWIFIIKVAKFITSVTAKTNGERR